MGTSYWISVITALASMPLIIFLTGLAVFKLGRGYNTPKAWKNPEIQRFASRTCGKLFMIMATPAMLFVAIICIIIIAVNGGSITAGGWSIDLTGVLIQTVAIIPPIVITQMKLSKYFDKNGNRRF